VIEATRCDATRLSHSVTLRTLSLSTMALYAKTIEGLCHDKQTIEEANRLFRTARANTGVGSGFDLGEDRTGLAAVCAYLASLKCVLFS
jgi:hypothetical protein